MTSLTISRPLKRSVRLAFAAASVAVIAACGSTGRTALPAQSVATNATTPSSATTPVVPPEPTTTMPAPVVTAATVATTPEATSVVFDPATTAATTLATTLATAAPTTELPTTDPPPSAPPASADPIVAVDADGNAVIVSFDGTTTLLYDGSDPDDAPPEEGPVVKVHGVAVTDDLGTGIVGTCCEPSPGSLIITSSADPTYELDGFGHAPVISPDQTQLAAITLDAIYVSRLDLSGSHDVAIETAGATVLDVEWVDDMNVVALVSSATEAALFRYQVTDEGLLATAVVSVPVSSALAGVSDGAVYAINGTATLAAFDAVMLTPLPALDIVLPAVPLSAAMHDGELRWIDQERILHIGDTVVAGHYISVA